MVNSGHNHRHHLFSHDSGLGDSLHPARASVPAPAVMESGGNEELCAGAGVTRKVPWAHWGPTLHLLGSQTVVYLTSCPFSSLTAAAGNWGKGSPTVVAVVPLSCGCLLGPAPFRRASSAGETGQEPSLGDAVGGQSRGYALHFGFLHPALRLPALSRF